MMKSVYIVWADYQRRAETIGQRFGVDVVFIKRKYKNKDFLLWLDYLQCALVTIRTIVMQRPKVVWVQLPPTPSLMVVNLLSSIYKFKVIADCHNAMFRKPWSTFPGSKKSLRRSHIVLVHNNDMEKIAKNMGINSQCLVSFEDMPVKFQGDVKEQKGDYLLFPASFSDDEPMENLFKAAVLLPECKIVITGRHEKLKDDQKAGVPNNVMLTGFLSKQELDKYILNCKAILGFTDNEGVQLSVCNEAIGAKKPMILSGTNTLRKLYPTGAIFADDNTSESISLSISQFEEQCDAIQDGVEDLYEKKEKLASLTISKIENQLLKG